jgi:hypothetical protein
MTNRTAPNAELPEAPRSPVADDGSIAFGRYRGAMEVVDWRRAGPNRLWRFLHWKRWQYAAFVGSDVVGAVAIADVGFATTAFAYVFDRRSRRVLADISNTSTRRSGLVADHVGVGARSRFRQGETALAIEHGPGGWTLGVRSPTLVIDATLLDGPSAAMLCAVARVPGGLANCTHKAHGLEVAGAARIGGREISLAGALGSLDHTSGLLARDTSWRWASGTSLDRSINLVEGFQEPLENAMWSRGEITGLPPVTFKRASSDPMSPWQVRSADGSVDLEFRAEGVRSQDKNLVLAISRWIQPIGTWTGTIHGVSIGELSGVLEDHVARW